MLCGEWQCWAIWFNIRYEQFLPPTTLGTRIKSSVVAQLSKAEAIKASSPGGIGALQVEFSREGAVLLTAVTEERRLGMAWQKWDNTLEYLFAIVSRFIDYMWRLRIAEYFITSTWKYNSRLLKVLLALNL